MIYCCKKLEKVIKDHDIGHEGEDVCIYKFPKYDDIIGDSIKINFCPFCGSKLEDTP